MKLKVFVPVAEHRFFHQLLSKHPEFAYALVEETDDKAQYFLQYLGKDLDKYLLFLEQCAEQFTLEETSNFQDFKNFFS